MERYFRRFVSEDKGTVTGDWAALVVGVLMLSAAVLGTLNTGPGDLADRGGAPRASQNPLG